MPDFELYRSFVAVYRAGTVSRAAESRYLTQPAMSQHVAALEAARGQRLFRRTSRGMLPTDFGKKLYAQVSQAVDVLEQVPAAEPAESPLVRLGSPQEFFHDVLLGSTMDNPFRLWLRFGTAHDLLDGLQGDELDLVVATQRLPSPAIEFEKLADERFVLVGGADHVNPDPAPTPTQLVRVENWLKKQRWSSYGTELPIVRRFWQQTFGRRPDIQPALVVPDLRTILKAVELGYGISLLPEYLCREALAMGRITTLWEPPQPVENELWIAYRRADRTHEDVRLAREWLKTTSRLLLN